MAFFVHLLTRWVGSNDPSKSYTRRFRFVWETSKAYGDLEYIVYGNERYTYKQAHKITATLAHLLVTK